MIEDDLSDKNLIERYKNGDKSSLTLLVKKWHKPFCKKAFWVLQDKDLSKDVAQECWIIIINKLHTLHRSDLFKSWALRIIYTKAIDAHRRRRKDPQELNRLDNTYITEPAEQIDKTALKTRLFSAIQNLSKQQQDVVRLFYVEKYSLKEISIILKIPSGTVKSRLFKAREQLKLVLKSYDYEK